MIPKSEYSEKSIDMNVDPVTLTGKKPKGNITITYIDSKAKSSPDILCVGKERHIIEPGLVI